MKNLFLALCLLVACGGKTGDVGSSGSSGSSGSTGSATSAETPLEEAALQWGRAALGGKRAEALALSLTYEQFAGLSNKQIEKADYDGELVGLLDKLAREGSENGGAKVVDAKVAEKKKLPAGEKLKREIEFAVVSLVVEADGKQNHGMPMFFILTDAGWRFSPKK